MVRIKLLALAAAFLCGTAFAEEITEQQARTVAENFITKDSVGQGVLPDRTVDAVTRRGGFYLVTLKPSGHVLVSVSRSAHPIPKFSEHDFVEPEAGSPQAAFLAQAETNAIETTGTKYEAQWKTLLGLRVLRLMTASTTPYVNIAPMLQSVWTQGYPYDQLMPVVNGSHTLVGCVATAYSQVMRYWEWPEMLDEDIVTEHSADGMWGHKWRLTAGTQFEWASMPYSGGYDNPTILRLGRGAMFAGMLAHMTYNTKASGAQTVQPGQNRWFNPPRVLDTSNSTLAEREEGMKRSLQNGCPFMVSVNYGSIGHAVVGDGWQESDVGAYVHLNYGWGSADNTYYVTSSPLGVHLDSKPRAMVVNKPLPTSAKLPVTVAWSFPTKGYAETLTGFTVAYNEVDSAVVDWTDDMSVGKGMIDGNCLSVEKVDETGHGNVMRIGTKADDATYTWPTMVATKDTVFSYDIHSYNALGMIVEIQLLDPAIGWISLATPEIGERSEIEWTPYSINLGQYAGKGIAIRVKATRTGSSSYNDDTARSTGVQFDNLKLTNVRQAKADVAGSAVASASARSLDVAGALVSGKTYLFQVTPAFSDGTKGIPGYRASCTIAAADSEKPIISSVESVVATAPKIQNGLYRDCYFGLNQFGVHGSASLTKLEAYLSNLAVIGEVQEQDATQPAGTMITAHGKVSIENAVTVEKKEGENGEFLVKVDASNLTTYLNNTGMILTLVGRNEAGDVVRKDMFLRFVKSGSETEIAVADLPESGTISGGGDTPSEPATVSCSVSFATMGGFAVGQMTVEKGKAIGTLPSTSRDGHTFLGWYTDISGGTRVTKDTVITGNVIFFAQWKEDTPVVTTYTVTFDPNGGSPEMSRFVNENMPVGTLPTTVTKSGCKLVGWFTAANGGTQVSAAQVIAGNVTYYAHWEDSSGGGLTDDGSTRFCHGVTKTGGAYDVTRSGTWNSVIPVAYNLIYWWVDRYYEANGSNPSDYVAPNPSLLPDKDGAYTIQSYAAQLLNSALPATLSAGAKREPYFPTATYGVNDWNGTASGDARAIAAGRQVYAHLANGPIGIKVVTSVSRSYGAVIWGCDYVTDGNDKYATAVYVTETTSNTRNDASITKRTFKVLSTADGNFTNVGIKDFNGSGSHGVIEYYYPITGVVVTKPDEPVTTYTVTFDSAGGSSVDSIHVEKDSTIATLPSTVRSGFSFVGWFNGDAQLTTATPIASNVIYTARWQENVVTPTSYTVVFDANGGSVGELSREVVRNAAVGELPVPTYEGYVFDGWYVGDEPVDENTLVADCVVYVAHWTANAPEVPSDEPVISGQKAGGNAVDTGTVDTHCGFRLVYNYWLARKLAIQEKKQLFILSGATWCSYCTMTKEYLQTLGMAFTGRFVVYYADKDNLVNSPYFEGGLPQYGSADPRTVNAFAGIYGEGTSGTPDWTKAWYATGSRLYYGNRGGFSQDEVNRTLSEASNKAFGDRVSLEVRGPSSVMIDKSNAYELYAVFADGTEMLVDHGVTWSLMSGAGALAVSTSDGDASAKLTVTSDQAVLRAESTYYFNGTVDFPIKATQESKIKALAILTDEINLEDNRSPVLKATATLDDDTVVSISGIGTWEITGYTKLDRNDPQLEETHAPNVTVDDFGRLTYSQGHQFEVCDHTLHVRLTANGISVSKDITVWGPTKVVPDSWELVSKTKRLAKYGVVRIKCSKLRYNYGGAIKTTTDTYYGDFRTVMQFSGGSSEYSCLRGLSFMSSKPNAGTWTMGLQARRVNGQYRYWSPENFASYHSESIENVAEGDVVCDAAHGLVTEGFFKAYWPEECAGKTTEQLQAFALGDYDNDGFANWEEYVLGTDPTDATDALCLMQGYQHLTAPANDLSAFQYKIMFAQRPGRYYYVYGKVNWSDGWTRVAKINFSGMDADQGLQITVLDQAKADNGKFFRVGAVLADHEFNNLSNAEVIPNLLVANRGSLIDLTNEALPLVLTSFDTDATDPGTVHVKVPAGAKAGDVLITAPAAAAKSMAALVPQDLPDGLKFAVGNTADGRLALKVVSSATPSVEGGNATVVVANDTVVVTPNAGVTEVTLVHVGEMTVEIPPSVDKVGGVASDKLVIRNGGHDVTKAMKFTPADGGLKVELDDTKVIDVNGEDIPVRPVLSGVDETEPPMEIGEASVTLGVKTIPGLRYRLKTCEALGDGWTPVGEPQTATGARLRLTAERDANPSSFFKITVTK